MLYASYACMKRRRDEKIQLGGRKSPNEEQKINYNERKIPHLDPMVYSANHMMARCSTLHTQMQTRKYKLRKNKIMNSN